MRTVVLGATGKTGRYLVARLCNEGHDVVAIGRDAARLEALDARTQRRTADLERPETVQAALAGATCVVSLAHARYTEALLAVLPDACERVVLAGSTRKFTRLPDPAADAVRRAEVAFLASGRAGVMLHPAMIYGAPDDRNVNRILHYLRRWPRGIATPVPLPGGGRSFVQPVFVDDVVDAFAAAATAPEIDEKSLVIAGPEPITYAGMVRACARALGRRAAILPVPTGVLLAAARAGAVAGLPLAITADEIRRAMEDKRFDIGAARRGFGFAPRPFAEGLRLKIERGWL